MLKDGMFPERILSIVRHSFLKGVMLFSKGITERRIFAQGCWWERYCAQFSGIKPMSGASLKMSGLWPREYGGLGRCNTGLWV